jgi:hypothetical protein
MMSPPSICCRKTLPQSIGGCQSSLGQRSPNRFQNHSEAAVLKYGSGFCSKPHLTGVLVFPDALIHSSTWA